VARKQQHEDHVNHEAWAIPYGDLITLLLAFFVVMYAVSSINEGKYRVLAESLNSAFQGAPRSLTPVQVGEHIARAEDGARAGIDPAQAPSLMASEAGQGNDAAPGMSAQMAAMADSLETAMDDLIDAQLVAINRDGPWIAVEIKTDILFPSASADIGDGARIILSDLAEVLRPLDNTIRVEGHTDDRPIATAVFPSNWELSAARAARIVREFERAGIDPTRMVVAGMGEHHPVADNATVEGRTRNRRVALVILEAGAAGPADERRGLGPVAGTPVTAPASGEVES
jgi:chemotaxis protein MotB